MTKKVRYGMSSMLNHGCQMFAEKAMNEDAFDDVINISQKNLAALIFGYTSIEAFINEIISVSEVSIKLTQPKKYFDTLIELEKKLSIKEKYNLLAAILKANLWDSSTEPFQSFEIIQTIRNEVIHSKGKWQSAGDLPINKLKPLFGSFNLNDKPEKSWQSELFQCKEFGLWVFEKTRELKENIHSNLLSKIEKK